MGDSVFLADDLRSYSGEISACRICHEEDFQRLEAPCACSGTVKFAHRDCIQRWCNEKGNTTCEICLEKFEPGYTSPPQKTKLNDTILTIRVSLEESRTGADQENEEEILEIAADKSATYCRSVALVFTALLLIRHIYVVLAVGVGGYPFSLLTLLLVKISGIVFPMYILLRIFMALLDTARHHSQNGRVEFVLLVSEFGNGHVTGNEDNQEKCILTQYITLVN
ncbi:uncharacterized protein LOC142529480 isoform X1 [Primulina tabacum]|uniref:uncharacterized protein LOC142529480 isoform X1 n=1 Tax=Primulina tabacum TaxID=48773 RepID=UPI003F5A57F8